MIIMKRTIFAALLLCSALLFADDAAPPDTPTAGVPRSPLAVDAIAQHDSAIKRAKEQYQAALLAADKKLIEGLDRALHVAMNNGVAEEVERIDAAKKQAVEQEGKDAGEEGDNTTTPGRYEYQYGADIHPIDLFPNGNFGPPGRDFQEKWIPTQYGVKIITRSSGFDLFRCSDGALRGVGLKPGIAVVLKKLN